MALVFRLAGVLLVFTLCLNSGAQDAGRLLDYWAYDSIHIPPATGTLSEQAPVTVAVVDDAFRFTHKELKGFQYKNRTEIPGNQLDDDGNGYIDDVGGWDISDYDSNVSIPSGREMDFYHGTYISSIITRVAVLHYGASASERIRIMPVKVLSDRAAKTYMEDGYKGISYAIENGADIICVAWSGGNPGEEELRLLREAKEKGILIISSVGNFNEEKILYPAMAPEVIAVAGINQSFRKEKHSNYGMHADIAAPAEMVSGAHPEQDNSYFHDRGTSAAAALVAGCAAVILGHYPEATNADISGALLNSTKPFNDESSAFSGKLGAGIVNLENALDYLSDMNGPFRQFSSLRPKGSLQFIQGSENIGFEVNPRGNYEGFYLEPDLSGIKKPAKSSLLILVNDTIWMEGNLLALAPGLFVPSSSWAASLKKNSLKKKDAFTIRYAGKTVDSTTLYCRGTVYLDAESGTIEDGSGDLTYANNCSCRWIIKVPEDKRITFNFEQMDTQSNVDYVYIVDGQTAIPENFIAKFSGQNLPPEVISRTNEVLVWFVSDPSDVGQGWKLNYDTR